MEQNQNKNKQLQSQGAHAIEAFNQSQWPDALDALIASPQHHKLLYENEFVRVLDTNIPPGEVTNLHTQISIFLIYFKLERFYTLRR